MRVSSTATLIDALLVTGFPYTVHQSGEELVSLFAAFLSEAQAVRRLGSAALDLCYVAAGRMDAFWEQHLKPWDMAAGALMLAEAGGRITRAGRRSLRPAKRPADGVQRRHPRRPARDRPPVARAAGDSASSRDLGMGHSAIAVAEKPGISPHSAGIVYAERPAEGDLIMPRTAFVVLAVLALVATAAPAVAQQSLSLNIGYFALRGEGGRVAGDTIVANLNADSPFELGYRVSDFNNVTVGAEWLIPLGNFLEVGTGVNYYSATVPSFYPELTNDNGSEITQSSEAPNGARHRHAPAGHDWPARAPFSRTWEPGWPSCRGTTRRSAISWTPT